MPASNPAALDRMTTLIELAATTTDERAMWHWANDIFDMIDSINLREDLYRAHQHGYLGYESDYGNQFTLALRTFLIQHPRCTLQIVDEYGDTHPIETEASDK